jgi:hypothetical protein
VVHLQVRQEASLGTDEANRGEDELMIVLGFPVCVILQVAHSLLEFRWAIQLLLKFVDVCIGKCEHTSY